MIPTLISFLLAADPVALPSPIVVHLQSDKPTVELTRLQPAAPETSSPLPTAVTVCRVPCGQAIARPPGVSFQITGEGVAPSDPFNLNGYDSAVTLKVKAGNKALHGIGTTVATVGAATAGAGVGMWIIPNGPLQPAGPYVVGTGLGILATGVVVWLLNSTEVTFEPAAR